MPTTQPSNPAPVGLPGALSQRTDGGPADRQPMRSLPDAAYGEQKAFHDIQSAAPMAEDPGPAPIPPTGLFEPTQRPEEPITSGIASGPGDGPEPFGIQTKMDSDTRMIVGYLPALRRAADIQGAPEMFKSFVRYMETFNE